MAYPNPEYDVIQTDDTASTFGGLPDAPEHSSLLAALGKGIADIGNAIVTGIKSIFESITGAPAAGAVTAARAPVITAKAGINSVLSNAGFRAAVKIGTGGINASVSLANGAVVPAGFRLDSAINAMSKLPQDSDAFNTLQTTCGVAFTSQGLSLSVVNAHINNGIIAAQAGYSIASAGVPNLSITAQGGILHSAPPCPMPSGQPESEGSDDSVENAILVAAIAATVAGVIAAKDVSISARMSTIGNTMYKTQIGGVSGNWEADPQAGVMSDAIETVTTATADVGIEVKEFISDAVETAPQNYTV